MRKLAAALVGAAAIVVALGQPASAQQKCTIALIPGLTTDAFYITMRKGARGGRQGGRLRPALPGRAGLQPGHPGAGARGGDRRASPTRS